METVRPKAAHSSHEVEVQLKGKGFKRDFEVRSDSNYVTVIETRYETSKRLSFLIRVDDARRLEGKVEADKEEAQSEEALDQAVAAEPTEGRDEPDEEAESPEEPGEDAEGGDTKTDRRLAAEFYIVGGKEPSEPFTIELIPCSIRGMSVIPAGKFLFGSDNGAPHEQPRREIELATFACGLMEVSNEDYLEFLNHIQETGDHSPCHPDEPPQHSHVPDRWDDESIRAANMPVTGVNWFDAYAYAAWRGWRLPTEEEWEKAARGTEGASFPWGEEEHLRYAIATGLGVAIQPVNTRPNGRSKFGLFNASGNVWEWTASAGPGDDQAIIRGGSFRTDLRGCRTYVRNWLDRTARRDDVGFRCAADLRGGEDTQKKRGEKEES